MIIKRAIFATRSRIHHSLKVTHSLTHPPTHSVVHSLYFFKSTDAHSVVTHTIHTHSQLTHSLTVSFPGTHSLTHSLTHCVADRSFLPSVVVSCVSCHVVSRRVCACCCCGGCRRCRSLLAACCLLPAVAVWLLVR